MTGSLQIKRGRYYVVLNIYRKGKRSQKWIDTQLPVRGNKTKAEKFLREQIAAYELEQPIVITSDVLFADYIKNWLKGIEGSVERTTYEGYEILAKTQIIPYFQQNGVKLDEVTSSLLQMYFDQKAENGRLDGKGGLSARSLKLHKNIITQALDEAVKNRLIASNPCQWVELPSIQRREPTFYSAEQIEKLLMAVENERLGLLIRMTVFYGLRRSEILGLQWSNVNLDEGYFHIRHTVVKISSVVTKNKTKNASSYRSFPLVPEFREALMREREGQQKNRVDFGDRYADSDYVFVWDDGRPFSPDYVSHAFQKILKKNHLPQIRFHDLRHSCASVLLSCGFTLKDVQEWLGHSDIKMTANVYGHLDMQRKNNIAEGMLHAIC